MKILHLDAGLFPGQSASRQLSQQLVERLLEQYPQATTVYRDLISEPVGHLDAEILQAAGTSEEARTERQHVEVALSEALLEELFAADILVIGAPMYNFSIPSQLKAWIDRVAQAGRTFRYTENGPEGLVQGKRVYLASARGGVYSTPEMAGLEHQESFLRTVLGFMGMTDVYTIRAEGLALGDEERQTALTQAAQDIAGLEQAAAAS